MADKNNNKNQWYNAKGNKKAPAKKVQAKAGKPNPKVNKPVSQNKPNPKMAQRPNNNPNGPKKPSPDAQKRRIEQQKAMKAKAEAEAKKAEVIRLEKEKKELKAQKKAEQAKKKKLSSRKNAEKKALRNGILSALVVALALFVLAFVIYHLYSYIAEKPEFSFVTNGSVEHTIGAKALIIRDETVISCNATGELVTQTTEGARVAKDQRIAMVVPADMATTVENLRNVQSQISEVQQELIAEGAVSKADTIYSDYNEKIDPVIDMIRLDSASGKLSDLSSYSSSVTVLLDERESALSEIEFEDERLSVLRSDERNYETQLENNSSLVYANKPGIVSFRLDGLETELKFDQLLTTDISTIKSAINKSSGAITSDLKISAGDNVARLAKNEKQYFAVYLNNSDSQASDFAVGTFHDLNVTSEGISISDCEVVRCDSDDKGMLIVFSTGRYVEALLDLRTVDIEIVISETSGMRVNTSSIVDKDFSDSVGFSVYFEPETGIKAESFAKDSIFNINVIENVKPDEEGNIPEPKTITCGSCTVVHCETLENGGVIVGFKTLSEYKNLIKVNNTMESYKAVFIDTASGLGTNVEHIAVTSYSGIGNVYVNDQGFVKAVRVIVTDYDREFAVIRPVGPYKEPDLDTVIITNPESCKPGDKVN